MQFPRYSVISLIGLAAWIALSGCMSEQKVYRQNLIQQPVLDATLAKEDFAFPSRPPRLSLGKEVYAQNCASCHAKGKVSYDDIRNVRPIDTYLMLTRGDQGHPTFKNLTRDQRWEALFYHRYLAGDGRNNYENKTQDVASIFGANCAVCHGSKGFADGPLYTGHAAAHELGMAPVKNAFFPAPANFHSYSRMYNRTDDQEVKYIMEGVYPSAMPAWNGKVDKDKNFTFNESLIRDLVKYLRGFSYEDDLPEDANAPTPAPDKSAGKKVSVLPTSKILASLEKSE